MIPIHFATFAIVGCAILYSAASTAVEFQRNGWGGEGRPSFTARDTSMLRLFEKPRSQKNRLFSVNQSPILYDKSVVLTIRSAPVVAVQEIKEVDCGTWTQENGWVPKPTVIRKGVQFFYLQYGSEGEAYIRYRGETCTAKLYDNKPKYRFILDSRPRTEWWVRVTDKNELPLGWLKVEEKRYIFHQREF